MEQETIDRHNEKCEAAKAEVVARGFDGPWVKEPNRLNWKHAGLDCMLVRHWSSLHWCGYVGVPPGHPAHGKGYDDVRITGAEGDDYPEVHGGLTFSEGCGGFVCHIPQEGEPDDLWWLGFDCAHSGDESPGHLRKEYPFIPSGYDRYKTLDYVKAETERLARQLSSASCDAGEPKGKL
jgi:hypothetical protein